MTHFIGPITPTEPHIGLLKNIEELKFLWKHSNHVGHTYLNLYMIKHWPKMPKLKKLDLGYLDGFESLILKRHKALKVLTARCPKVRKFAIATRSLTNEDIFVIVKGWPRLLKLKVSVSQTHFYESTTRLISSKCKFLKEFWYQSCAHWWNDFDIGWQFEMYKNISTLRRIHTNDAEIYPNNDNIVDIARGTSRSIYHARENRSAAALREEKKRYVQKLLEIHQLPDLKDTEENLVQVRMLPARRIVDHAVRLSEVVGNNFEMK